MSGYIGMMVRLRGRLVLLLDFFLILHQHNLSITIHIVSTGVTLTSHHLHLIIGFSSGLGTCGKWLSILGPFVYDWHVLEIVDV